MAKVTPMMEQYFQIKKKYKYALLFYRLGDFYELFYDDAKIASRELDLVLTGKNVGTEERAPMCGVPYHAADNYIAKLVNSGFKVAVCEQVEDPKLAKGIVKREVVRVITPGTIMDTNALQSDKNNYVMSVFKCRLGFGVSSCDITTGTFLTTEFDADGMNKVIDEIARYSPSEIICNSDLGEESIKRIENIFSIKPSIYEEYNFDFGNADMSLCNHFNVLNLFGYGLEKKPCAVSAAGALLNYVKDAQKNGVENLRSIKYYERTGGMILDIGSRRNLEITATIRDNAKKGSLLGVLDDTKTPMGARFLRNALEQPLTDKFDIEKRLDGVEILKNDMLKRSELRDTLKQVYDMERIMGKLVYGSAHGRDLAALRASLSLMPKMREILESLDCIFVNELLAKWDDLADIYTLLYESIAEEPPLGIKDAGVIKTGFDPELDKLREAMEKGTGWLIEMEAKEREKTGIKNLKIRFNKVHGYYIEVSNSYLDQVPDTYTRRQTLTTGERFINPELKELEETLLTAEDRLTTLEAEIFAKIKQKAADEYARVMQQAELVAKADFIQSLAATADKYNYTKPEMSNEKIIKITNGRHPVVERQDGCQYIPNDTDMTEENVVSIITGPNMAGKSTYMRQVALIVLMAQTGSFVPADSAQIGITDRIFTRIGASDDLATGQSTFMVEMVEVANILNNASEKSLLILDELGRGTSTYDGMSIAWAVIEHIAKKIKARTLFSTHYQELTALSERMENVKNYCVSVMEQGEEVIFLRKIKEGSADKSYGVHVAKLAGVPKSVVRRANQVLSALGTSNVINMTINDRGEYIDPEVYNDEKVRRNVQIAEYLENLDMDEISPKEAWEKLNTLNYMIKNNFDNF